MQQLSGLDAAFVHQDSARTPMHMSVALIYDIADHESGITLEELTRLARVRLSSFPLVWRKLKRVTLDMDTPYWLDVPSAGWEQHLHQHVLPAQGTWQQLQGKLADIHAQQMNLNLPLWEMHLIDGLRDMGGMTRCYQVVMLKVHHAALDGMSLAAFIAALHSPHPYSADEAEDESQELQHQAEDGPGRLEVWARAGINNIGRQFKFVGTASNMLPRLLNPKILEAQGEGLLAGATRFNGRVHAGRSTDALILEMSKVLAVKRAVKRVSMNDIALCCVAGALQRYLHHHQNLPARTLAAGVPINLRGKIPSEFGGNKIATMIVKLATDIDDPVERLRAIHGFAVQGKHQVKSLGAESVMDFSDALIPGFLAEGIKAFAWAGQTALMPLPYHTIVSNVPGPRDQLWLGKCKLMVPLGLGPVRDNMGVFHAVSNSGKWLSISFSACATLLPDPEFYRQCLQFAFDELEEQALQ